MQTCQLNVKRVDTTEYALCFDMFPFNNYKCSNIYIVMFCDMVACDGLGIDEIITNVANM